MQKTINAIIWIVILVLIIDAIGFMAWSVSGQVPADNFHAGVITKTFINKIQ